MTLDAAPMVEVAGEDFPEEEVRSSERIRLLFVTSSSVRGGAEEVVLALLRGLSPHEFELALACPAPLLKSLGRDLASLDVATLAVEPSSWFYFRHLWRLGGFIRRFRPHVVNSHLFRATLVAAPIAKLLGVPLVIETYHGREAWRRGAIKKSFFVDRIVLHCVDRVIAVSRAARDFLIARKLTPSSKITVVPNGRELAHFVPGRDREAVRAELGISEGLPLVGMVGRLEPQKGHRYLLEALPAVLAEVPGALLLVVGEGSLESELRGRAAALGIEGSIRFLGYRSDVARVMDAVDLLVMPSLYEGMPLIAIEAAAMAKPIVASRVDGTEEVVLDGETGLLVPPADPPMLAGAMVELLRDRGRCLSMGQKAREVAVSRFDLRNQIETTAKFYRSEYRRVCTDAHVR